jgi:hypothetical protein
VPRDEVVFADRVERDVLDQDLLIRPRDPSGSVAQAFTLRILADSQQQLSDGSLRSRHVDAGDDSQLRARGPRTIRIAAVGTGR